MVKVYVENGEFVVKGTFDFGYLGLYKDDQLGINCSCAEIRDEWDSIYELTKDNDFLLTEDLGTSIPKCPSGISTAIPV